ncbi:MAG: hypothetical protein JRI46_11815 [Deltaproteobacteria bacterium]|nr:hypothetical protein [Deltaproteobacteria bacterium]
MKKIGKILVIGLAIAVSLCFTAPVSAESDLAIGGPASVDLDFQITIPTILYLQVGTAGATIDTVTFTVDDLPGTGAVAQNEAAIYVRAAGFVGSGSTMTLSSDSSSALTNGTDKIPFDEISWAATGDFAGGAFDNGAAQKLDQFTGSGNRTGTYTFSYDNDTYYPTGTYTGTVTYTLSSP